MDLDTRRWGGATTLGLANTDQLVVVTENDWFLTKDSEGNELKQTFADKLMHELVGHAIPNVVGTDTGNAIKNENKVRAERKKPLRKEEEHPE